MPFTFVVIGLHQRTKKSPPCAQIQLLLEPVRWENARSELIITFYSVLVGVSLAVVTYDGYVICTERGENVGTASTQDANVIDGLSRPLDRGTTGEAPDVYRCACRELADELGLHESVDFAVADITFLSFGVDTCYALRGLIGVVKINRSIEKLLYLTGTKNSS